MSDFKALINDSEFSDFAVIAAGQKILCHKAILAIRSGFFKRVLCGNRALKEYTIKTNNFDVGKGIIDYLYTGKISVSAEKCEEVYILAGDLEMAELQKLCEEVFDKADLKSRPQAVQVEGSGSFIMLNGKLVETDKMREKRKMIAKEIMDTETTYVKSLQVIFDEFVCPLRKSSSEKGAILSSDEITQVFSYWEVLLKCHVSLLKVIEERMKVWDDLPEMGDIFCDKIAFIKLYKHYINNFDKSIVAIKELKEKHSKFKEFLSKLEFSPKLSGLGLQSFLILPVQRIPRYVLLLQDMLKNTIPDHPDHPNLETAQQNIKELADYINANKNDADEINKILSIQDKLVNWPSDQSLVKPRRRLVREGFLSLQKDKMNIFLFSDALLYCKPKGKDKLKYKGLVWLQTSSLNINIKPSEKYDFEIISQTGKLHFTSQPDEKESWIKSIGDCIEKAQKELLNSAFSGFEQKGKRGF